MRFKLVTHSGNTIRRNMYPTNFLKRVLTGKKVIDCAHLKRTNGKVLVIHEQSFIEVHLMVGRVVKSSYERS